MAVSLTLLLSGLCDCLYSDAFSKQSSHLTRFGATGFLRHWMQIWCSTNHCLSSVSRLFFFSAQVQQVVLHFLALFLQHRVQIPWRLHQSRFSFVFNHTPLCFLVVLYHSLNHLSRLKKKILSSNNYYIPNTSIYNIFIII